MFGRKLMKPSVVISAAFAIAAIVAPAVFASVYFGKHPAKKTITLVGTWRKLPSAPSAVAPGTSVWTGKQLIVFGNVANKSADVTEAYDPDANTWRRLAAPPTSVSDPGYNAVWTGKKMLVWGAFHSLAFDPRTHHWQVSRKSLPEGIVLWTGHEAIGWGGGCCGDAQSNGAAYNPTTGAFRKLPSSPLAPSQSPLGVWTGRELILFVSGFDPDGKPSPAKLARAAAYDPAKNTWRRISALPGSGPRFAGTAVWDGREVLIAGAGTQAQSAYAYNPTTDTWRRLTPLPSARIGATAVWTGKRLILWGGRRLNGSTDLRDGLAYDPHANRWSLLPQAPFRARGGSTVAWTGHALIVWGGEIGTPGGTSKPPTFPRDGAVFRPAAS